MFTSFFNAVRYFVFWLLFFFIERFVFLAYFFKKIKHLPPAETSKAFLYGLWMDVSMAAYVCALPLLAYILLLLMPKLRLPKRALDIYTYVFLFLFALIAIININIYNEWGSKISYKVVEYAVNSPKEAMAASSSSPVLLSFLLLLLLCLAAVFLYKKLTVPYRFYKLSLVQAIACVVVLLLCEITAIRGGWQLAPMNESMAYYSGEPLLNYSAVNTEWSFLNDVVKNKFSKYGNKNPYHYFAGNVADSLVKQLYTSADTATPFILTTKRPNVVVILMESFTADVVESLGGEKGIDPGMEGLIKEGVLFTNIFASGDRTDKGTVAVLSGFPSQAITSIIKYDDKQKHLPSIAGALAQQGYATSFYYGGESEFVNTKSFLLSHAYQHITDKKSFAKKDMNSKWGAFDEVVFNRQLQDITHAKEPFFSTIMTLTNHEPFELPGRPHFGDHTIPDKFRSTAYYADSCIADYMHKAAQQPWFKNTLFVLVADHGHRLPEDKYEINDYHRFRIPFLLYGGAIQAAWKGIKIDKTGSQTDVAATLLRQLDVPANVFAWSRNLLDSAAKSFAFYDWDNGFGFATPSQIISFDNVGKTITFRQHSGVQNEDSLLHIGKAYMQAVYQRYLDY